MTDKEAKKQTPGKIKKRKLSLEEVEKLLREFPLKVFSKAVKTAKTFNILKSTRKLQALRNDSNKDDEISRIEERIENLKKLNHAVLGKHLAQRKYPQIRFDDVDTDASTELPAEDIINQITSQKKYIETIHQFNIKFTELLELRNDLLTKQRNRELNSKKATSSSISKKSAVKAIFVESLADNEETRLASADPDELDRRSAVKLQKMQRNTANRERNRKEKQDLSSYMPVEDRNSNDDEKFVQPKNKSNFTNNKTDKRPMKRPPPLRKNDKQEFEHKRARIEKPASSQKGSSTTNTNNNHNNNHQNEFKQLALDGREWKESGVHPSWAAKQMQKSTALVEGQGKKITFD